MYLTPSSREQRGNRIQTRDEGDNRVSRIITIINENNLSCPRICLFLSFFFLQPYTLRKLKKKIICAFKQKNKKSCLQLEDYL